MIATKFFSLIFFNVFKQSNISILVYIEVKTPVSHPPVFKHEKGVLAISIAVPGLAPSTQQQQSYRPETATNPCVLYKLPKILLRPK